MRRTAGDEHPEREAMFDLQRRDLPVANHIKLTEQVHDLVLQEEVLGPQSCMGFVSTAELVFALDFRERVQHRLAAFDRKTLDLAEQDFLHEADELPPGLGQPRLKRLVHRTCLRTTT